MVVSLLVTYLYPVGVRAMQVGTVVRIMFSLKTGVIHAIHGKHYTVELEGDYLIVPTMAVSPSWTFDPKYALNYARCVLGRKGQGIGAKSTSKLYDDSAAYDVAQNAAIRWWNSRQNGCIPMDTRMSVKVALRDYWRSLRRNSKMTQFEEGQAEQLKDKIQDLTDKVCLSELLKSDKIVNKRNLKRVLVMLSRGYSYRSIAKKLSIHKTDVSRLVSYVRKNCRKELVGE